MAIILYSRDLNFESRRGHHLSHLPDFRQSLQPKAEVSSHALSYELFTAHSVITSIIEYDAILRTAFYKL
jgi:hypothetical protein